MEIKKSSRHAKITGNFGESLVLYWLSKYGFECAQVDHTGIDIIARNPHTDEVMGISVKSRSRNEGKQTSDLTIPNKHFDKIKQACQAFKCAPYFAIIVDAASKIDVYITTMEHLLELHPQRDTAVGWKMGIAWQERYRKDPKIMHVEFEYETHAWWTQRAKGRPADRDLS